MNTEYKIQQLDGFDEFRLMRKLPNSEEWSIYYTANHLSTVTQAKLEMEIAIESDVQQGLRSKIEWVDLT